jgi:hypothetical protein
MQNSTNRIIPAEIAAHNAITALIAPNINCRRSFLVISSGKPFTAFSKRLSKTHQQLHNIPTCGRFSRIVGIFH